MRTRRDRGSTLFVVLFFIVVLSAFAGAAFNFTSGTASAGLRSTQMTLGYGVADAAMETVYSRWRAIAQAHTTKNLNARVFTDPSSVYNRSVFPSGKDITVVTLADLGLPSGYLGLPSNIADPNANDSNRAGTITIQTVDVYGRPYGDWSTYGLNPVPACMDPATTLIEATNRANYNASTNDFYPPPGTPNDYTFLTAIGSANGFNAVNIIYEVQVQLNIPSRNGPITVNVKRQFTRSLANAAQAAIFFENRLELFPGSNMSVAGRVHTNDSLYQGTRLSAGTTLDFLKKVSYAGADYNANASGAPVANHNIVQVGYGSLNDSSLNSAPVGRFQGNSTGGPDLVAPMLVGGVDRDYLKPFDTAQNPSYNNNSLREIIERPVRRTGKTGVDPTTADYNSYWDVGTSTVDAAVAQAAIESARLYNQASIKVSLAYDPATGLIDPSRTVIRGATPAGMADGPNLATTDPTLYLAILDTLNRPADGSGSYLTRTRLMVADARESRRGAINDIATTTVDVGALKAAIEASTSTHFNGILYVADVTNQDLETLSYNNGMAVAANANRKDFETTSDGKRLKHGIMLTNGATLPGADNTDLSDPERAFTVASENAVYIKGDYNTGGVGSAVPSNRNNTVDGSATAVSGYNPVTAAVMGDAISVVSRNFDPTKGYDDFYQPRVSTFDPALAAAIMPSTGVEVAPGTPGSATALSRQAVSTTVNTAVVSGIFQNNATEAGGGASNLLRFMENWGQVPKYYSSDKDFYDPGIGVDTTKFTYKGSMMQSFYSKEFTSPWSPPSTRQAYNAPVRDVQFDETYITKPPEGFPKTITYVKGAWQRF